ncbi:MAG: sigma-70 family RNA polymerase sigma factor, partial [Myxococcota bacterium]
MDRRQKLRAINSSPESVDAEGDDLLMLLAASGDQHAFAKIVDRYQPSVRKICSLLLDDDGRGREAAQEVFLRLWGMRERYDAKGRLKYLLYTVARNYCRVVRRKRRLQSLLGSSEQISADERPSDDPGPDLLVARSQMRALIARGLQQLPEKFRIPLMLRFQDEMPYEEIAAVIGRTPSADLFVSTVISKSSQESERPSVRQLIMPATGDLAIDDLEDTRVELAHRGSSPVFRSLFGQPFGRQ